MGKTDDINLKIDDLKFNTFIDEELESLQLFHRQVEKMRECKVVKTKSLRISVSHERIEDGLKTTMEAPDDEDLSLLLLRIRPCLLERDRIFFNRIINILGRNAASKETRDILDYCIRITVFS